MKRRNSVPMDMVCLDRLIVFVSGSRLLAGPILVIIIVVFGVENDGPSCWKDGVICREIVGFEEHAAEYWRHGKDLSVG